MAKSNVTLDKNFIRLETYSIKKEGLLRIEIKEYSLSFFQHYISIKKKFEGESLR